MELARWIVRWGMKERKDVLLHCLLLWTSGDWFCFQCPIFFTCYHRCCISSLKTGDAGFDTNPLPGILNCLGSLFLYRVVWLLKFNHCQHFSMWCEPLLAPCLLMYATPVISIVMSLVSVSNAMELPARCFLGLQNVLACSLGAAVFIKLKVLSACSEMIREFSFISLFPPAACRHLTFGYNKSLFPFFICKVISPQYLHFIAFYPSSFLHSHPGEDPAQCAEWIYMYFKTFSAPWKNLSSSILICFFIISVLLSLLLKS